MPIRPVALACAPAEARLMEMLVDFGMELAVAALTCFIFGGAVGFVLGYREREKR
jgi:hypothetical protein